jgi:hypothetical protein
MLKKPSLVNRHSEISTRLSPSRSLPSERKQPRHAVATAAVQPATTPASLTTPGCTATTSCSPTTRTMIISSIFVLLPPRPWYAYFYASSGHNEWQTSDLKRWMVWRRLPPRLGLDTGGPGGRAIGVVVDLRERLVVSFMLPLCEGT